MNEVSRRLQDGMTVQQLIDELKNLDPHAHVVFSTDYGDYHHTAQAIPAQEVVELDDELEIVVESAYSNSGLALLDLSDVDDPDDRSVPAEYPSVVVIR